MEETIGECTNLHITYPAMVFGYPFVIRANRMIEEAAAIASEEDAAPAKQLNPLTRSRHSRPQSARSNGPINVHGLSDTPP